MLLSFTAATPFIMPSFCASAMAPTDWSVTVPRITAVVPTVIAVIGASTVVPLGPLPKQYIWLSYAFRPTM